MNSIRQLNVPQRWTMDPGWRVRALRHFLKLLPLLAVAVLGQDTYEDDDTPAQATIFTIGQTQQHDFHSASDEDWVKFYASTGMIFQVDATQLSANSDVRLEVYYEEASGNLQVVADVDDSSSGEDETESLTLDLKTGQSGLLPGMYYVRVSLADTNLFGPGSEYSLQIFLPIGLDEGPILLNGNGGLFAIGRFSVYLDPPQAVAAGAGWRIKEATNMNYLSAIATYGLITSNFYPTYHIEFRPVPGFTTPATQAMALSYYYTNHTTNIQAYYIYTNLSPQAQNLTLGTNGLCSITYLGNAGSRYAVEESTNLFNWKALITNQVPLDGLLRFSTTNSPAKSRAFYRAHQVP